MTIVPEIRIGFGMMRYVVLYPGQFHEAGSLFALLVCALKVLGAFYAELINIWKMGQQDNIEDIVKDFIAFGIIAEIDNVVARGIKDLDVEKQINEFPIIYDSNDDHKTVMQILSEKQNMTTSQYALKVAILCFYKVFDLLYVTVYFYFFPFSILILVFLFGNI